MKIVVKLSNNELNVLRETLDILENIQEVIVTETDEVIDEDNARYDTTDINCMCHWLNNFLTL